MAKSSVILSVTKGAVFFPRFFCCDDPNALGITAGKEPVAIIEVVNPNITNTAIPFDGTSSYDPDGTVTGFSWLFAGGTPSTSTSSTENVTYASPGTFTATLTVTDGTGLTSIPASIDMIIEIPTDFYAASSTGLWFTVDNGQNWTQIYTTTGVLDFLVYKQDDVATRRIWIVTSSTIEFSHNNGTLWTVRTPTTIRDDFNDPTPPVIGDVLWKQVSAGRNVIAIYGTYVNDSKARSVLYEWTNGDWIQRVVV